MSVGQSRLCLLVGRCSPLFARQSTLVAPSTVEGRRTLTMNPKYEKPYPYERKSFGYFKSLFEYTTKRLNENSRILIVDGPPCVGKSEFAQNLARTFQLKYLPPVKEEDLFMVNGFDLRQMNDIVLSDKMKTYDLDMFYAETDPQMKLMFGGMQMNFYKLRFKQYVQALRHLLHTGQGVVIENSIYGDTCYALNMADHGYFTKKGIRWLMEFYQNAQSVLWKPHLVIHLDAPSSLVVKRMKEKYPKYEDSPMLTESYFDGLRDKIQNTYIPWISEHCDTLYYDVTDMEEFDLIAMDLEQMDLISKRFKEGIKFQDWHKDKEEEWSMYRVFLNDETKLRLSLQYRLPMDCPELLMNGEETYMWFSLTERIPQLKYSSKYWQDRNGNVLNRPELAASTPFSPVSSTNMLTGNK